MSTCICIHTYIHTHTHAQRCTYPFWNLQRKPVTWGVLDLWPVTGFPDSTDTMEKKTVEFQRWVCPRGLSNIPSPNLTRCFNRNMYTYNCICTCIYIYICMNTYVWVSVCVCVWNIWTDVKLLSVFLIAGELGTLWLTQFNEARSQSGISGLALQTYLQSIFTAMARG